MDAADQALQFSITDRGGAHEVLPLPEELLTANVCYGKRSCLLTVNFLNGVAIRTSSQGKKERKQRVIQTGCNHNTLSICMKLSKVKQKNNFYFLWFSPCCIVKYEVLSTFSPRVIAFISCNTSMVQRFIRCIHNTVVFSMQVMEHFGFSLGQIWELRVMSQKLGLLFPALISALLEDYVQCFPLSPKMGKIEERLIMFIPSSTIVPRSYVSDILCFLRILCSVFVFFVSFVLNFPQWLYDTFLRKV